MFVVMCGWGWGLVAVQCDNFPLGKKNDERKINKWRNENRTMVAFFPFLSLLLSFFSAHGLIVFLKVSVMPVCRHVAKREFSLFFSIRR